MNIIGRIEIPVSNLDKTGDFSEDSAPETRLSGTVEVALRHEDGSVTAHLAHLEFVQVNPEPLTSVNDWLDDDVERIVGLEGDRPQTSEIKGKQYVFYIIPFAE